MIAIGSRANRLKPPPPPKPPPPVDPPPPLKPPPPPPEWPPPPPPEWLAPPPPEWLPPPALAKAAVGRPKKSAPTIISTSAAHHSGRRSRRLTCARSARRRVGARWLRRRVGEVGAAVGTELGACRALGAALGA